VRFWVLSLYTLYLHLYITVRRQPFTAGPLNIRTSAATVCVWKGIRMVRHVYQCQKVNLPAIVHDAMWNVGVLLHSVVEEYFGQII